jgi:hypothetical protein
VIPGLTPWSGSTPRHARRRHHHGSGSTSQRSTTPVKRPSMTEHADLRGRSPLFHNATGYRDQVVSLLTGAAKKDVDLSHSPLDEHLPSSFARTDCGQLLAMSHWLRRIGQGTLNHGKYYRASG